MISSTNCYFLKPFTRLPHQWRGSYLQQFEYCIDHLLDTTLHIQIGNIKCLYNKLQLFVKGCKAMSSSHGENRLSAWDKSTAACGGFFSVTFFRQTVPLSP